ARRLSPSGSSPREPLRPPRLERDADVLSRDDQRRQTLAAARDLERRRARRRRRGAAAARHRLGALAAGGLRLPGTIVDFSDERRAQSLPDEARREEKDDRLRESLRSAGRLPPHVRAAGAVDAAARRDGGGPRPASRLPAPKGSTSSSV